MKVLLDFIDFLTCCWPPLALGALLIAGFGAVIYYAVAADIKARDEFMAECEQHHAKYECTAMWRAGEPDYVPVVVPVSAR